MAWPRSLSRSSIQLVRCSLCLTPKLNYSESITPKVEIDHLDEFTTKLVQKKSEKWSLQKLKFHRPTAVDIPVIKKKNVLKNDNVDLESLSMNQINAMFQNCIINDDYETIVSLIKECIVHKKCPNSSVISSILAYCASIGDRELISGIRNLCSEIDPTLKNYNGQGFFDIHLAEAIWIKGDINKSLTLFESVYRENLCLRRKIRLILKNLISSIISSRSEAVLINIIAFCEGLQKEFNDIYPLVFIWQYCFLSDWFSDQTLALDLLRKNEELFSAISSRIQFVVSMSLRNNNTDVVYRLLEYILSNGLKSHCSGILIALFDYHLKQRNLRGCSAIVQWCQENNVKLPDMSNEKILEILVKHETNIKIYCKKDEQKPKSYDLKF